MRIVFLITLSFFTFLFIGCDKTSSSSSTTKAHWKTTNNLNTKIDTWYISRSISDTWTDMGHVSAHDSEIVECNGDASYDSKWIWADGDITYKWAVYISKGDTFTTTWDSSDIVVSKRKEKVSLRENHGAEHVPVNKLKKAGIPSSVK